MKQPTQLAKLIAVLFYSGQPVRKADLQESIGLSELELDKLLAVADIQLDPLGLVLSVDDQMVQLVTNNQVAATISSYFQAPKAQLSQANLEVLAVVAYRQPITREEIDDIRGVASDQTLKNLVNKDLVKKVQHKQNGQDKTMYTTTTEFLNTVGVRSLKELPKTNANFAK